MFYSVKVLGFVGLLEIRIINVRVQRLNVLSFVRIDKFVRF